MRRTSVEVVETARLRCERLRLEHVAQLTPFLLDSQVVRALWPYDAYDAPTEEDVAASTAAKVDHWERYGFGLWLLRDLQTGAMVGRGGLQYTYAAGLNDVEAAWAIVPDCWGQGLATELALAAIDVAFDALELPWIVALALPENRASRRVMEKTGFTYQRDIAYAGLPHMLYERRPDS